MADLTYRADARPLEGWSRISWGAIFAGTFGFLAVWATFGALGLGIFASAANPSAAAPVTGGGMTIGEAIWFIVLSIISLYVGGRIAAGMSHAITRKDGIIHGFVSFGLSIVAALMLVGLTLGATTTQGIGAVASTHSAWTLTAVADSGYALFVALLLGGIAAMAGGSQAVHPDVERSRTEVSEGIRRVA